MKTKILFMLLALPLIFTACSNDDEEEDKGLVGLTSCLFQSEISFYNADGTECDIEQYADDLGDAEITKIEHYGSRDDYVENDRFDENTDSIVGNKMYVELGYIEINSLSYIKDLGDVDFYLKLKSSKLFGNEDKHAIHITCDGQKGLIFEYEYDTFIKDVASQSLSVTWQPASYAEPLLLPRLPIKVVLPER